MKGDVIHLDRARAARNRERRDRGAPTALAKLLHEGLISPRQWKAGHQLRHFLQHQVWTQAESETLCAVVTVEHWAAVRWVCVGDKLPTDLVPIRAGLTALADHWGYA